MATQPVLAGETVSPHGGRLVDLLLRGPEAAALRVRATSLPVVRV